MQWLETFTRRCAYVGVSLLLLCAPGIPFGVELGGSCFCLQALLLACQCFCGLGTVAFDVFVGAARLHLLCLAAGVAGAVGVADRTRARIGAAQHLRIGLFIS